MELLFEIVAVVALVLALIDYRRTNIKYQYLMFKHSEWPLDNDCAEVLLQRHKFLREIENQ